MRDYATMLEHRFPVLICVFIVFVIGVLNLKSDPIENDEFRTLNHIEPVWLSEVRTIPETVASVSALSPQHGPLYFIVLNVWHKLVDSDLFSLRLLSTFFGVLTIAMLYRLATLTGKREDGTSAAIVLSFLAFYLFHVHYLRVYALLSLASCWILWSYWVVKQRRLPSRLLWLSLFAATALMPYIHYMGSLIPLAVGVYHVVFVRRDRRWWRIILVMALAGLMFLPWLPVVFSGLVEHTHDLGAAAARLTAFEAIRAVLSIFSNGLLPLPVIIAAWVLLQRKRLNGAEKYFCFVVLFATASLFALNEFAPLLVSNRMRYTIALLAPYCCFVAIGLRMLPAWKRIRVPLLAIWCLSFVYYLGTQDYAIFTNIQQHETDKIPNYQAFIYETENLPGHNELILSFHPNMELSSNKTLPYYRSVVPRWAYIVHMTYNEHGDLVIQSGHGRYGSLDAIAANSIGIWVLHNPAQTALDEMPVFTDWFLEHFKVCQRFHDTDLTVIDYYVAKSVPCDLITNEKPFTIHYDNGMVLANALSERNANELIIYLWWHETIGKEYSLSLQMFDETTEKVGQQDRVISSEPIDAFSFDLSGLSPGEYTVEMIVYNFETKQSAPGTVASSQQRFDRNVIVSRFSFDQQS